jgi:hypothetical protein
MTLLMLDSNVGSETGCTSANTLPDSASTQDAAASWRDLRENMDMENLLCAVKKKRCKESDSHRLKRTVVTNCGKELL